ncbi:hypothetical protein D3C79_930000 [compost metagenome]
MMRHAEGAVTNAAADSDQLHVCAGICDVNLNLFDTAHTEETSWRRNERFLAAVCETGRDAHDVLFCYANFHKLIRICIGKRSHGCRASGIAGKHHNAAIIFCEFEQRIANNLSIRNRICHDCRTCLSIFNCDSNASSSASALAKSSSLGT